MSHEPDALILFAHGARDPRWALPFQTVAARIRAVQPRLKVQLAFLDFMSPDLAGAAARVVAEGASRIDIVPMFLGAGGHVKQDLPQLLAALHSTHPHASFRLHPAIGEIDAVTQAMATAIVATVQAAR